MATRTLAPLVTALFVLLLVVVGFGVAGHSALGDTFVAQKCPTPTPGTPAPTNTPGGVTKTFTPTGTPCSVKLTVTPTPSETTSPLPDLVALSMGVTLETGGDCNFTSTKLGVRVFFSNAGDADAGPFVVTVNGVQQNAEGLQQGESGSLWFNGYNTGLNSASVDSSSQVVESNESNNSLLSQLPVPTLPPTCTPDPSGPTETPTKQPDPGDTDGDGCSDQRENGLDETLGGQRAYKNPWDFFDTNGDQIIDLASDIFDVIQHYAPTGNEPTYDATFDRGSQDGANPWNMTAPDGVIDLSNDILGVIQQYLHDCR